MPRKHALSLLGPAAVLALLAACGGGSSPSAPGGGESPLVAYTGTFKAGPSLLTPRRGHVAIALDDGRALILGGVDGASNPVAACELYDPAGQGGFRPAGSLPVAGRYFAAALLSDGRVLVTGGEPSGDPFNAYARADIFDPASGRWLSGPAMPAPRSGHSLFGLPDGRAVVCGGQFDFTACFQLAAGAAAWSSAGSSAHPHFHHGAALLSDGRVLIAGGDQWSDSAAADLFDPRAAGGAGAFQPTGGLCHPRFWFGLAPLPGGRALVVGGVGAEHSGYIKDPELFDPALQGGQGGFTRIAAQPQNAPELLVPLADGRVLLLGSASAGASAAAELFDAAANQGQGGFAPTGSLSTPRQGAAAVRLKSGRVLVTGGADAQRNLLQGSEIFE